MIIFTNLNIIINLQISYFQIKLFIVIYKNQPIQNILCIIHWHKVIKIIEHMYFYVKNENIYSMLMFIKKNVLLMLIFTTKLIFSIWATYRRDEFDVGVPEC